jgi:outer membrane protein assembly factor BamB
VALDLKSGDTVWQKSFPANKSSLIEQLSTPATGGGLVYFGVVDGTLVALDAKSGTRKWKQATDGPIYSSPAYSDGTLYVGSTDNHVYAFRASDGKSLWKFQTGGDVISSPVVMDGVVYAGSSDKYLYALNATTGALFWSALIGDKDSAGTINHAGNGVLGKPAVSRAAQAVYVTSGGSLYGVRIRDGGRRGRFQSGGDEFAQMSSPVAADTLGLVYFGSGDGTLYAINL